MDSVFTLVCKFLFVIFLIAIIEQAFFGNYDFLPISILVLIPAVIIDLDRILNDS